MAQTWSYVGAGAVNTGQNPFCVYPAGIQAGDLMLTIATSGATYGTTAPSGWAIVVRQTASPFLTVYSRTAVAGDVGSNVNLANTNTASCGRTIAYRGIASQDVVSTFTTATATSVSSGTVTTTAADDLVLSIFGSAATATTWTTAITGTTNRVSQNPTSTVTGFLVNDEDKATAGATTARSGATAASSVKSGCQISFKQSTVITATVANASSATTEATAAVTQAHALSVAGGSSATTADAVAITQSSGATSLTVDNASSATTAGTVALTQAQGLTVASGSGAETVSTVALTQAQALTVVGATSAGTESTPAVAQQQALTVSGASVGTTESTPAVTQAHALSVVGESSATTLQTVAIPAAGSIDLAVAGMSSATTADALAIDTPPSQQPAGGWDDDKKKKHLYYVQKGRRLMVFDNQDDALAVLNAPEKKKQAPERKVAVKAIAKAKTVRIPQVQAQAKERGQDELAARLLEQAQYEALLALVQRWQDEEEDDIEALLLAL